VKSHEDISSCIANTKKKHYDANHNCYSYILGDEIVTAKSSDDGEPSRTAGLPIYEVLKKNNITNVLAVVTRYFGGVKLGSGGLIRAYGSSVAKALEVSEIIKIEKLINILIEFDYTYINTVLKYISTYQEISKTFEKSVKIEFLIPLEDESTLITTLTDATNNNIKFNVTK